MSELWAAILLFILIVLFFPIAMQGERQVFNRPDPDTDPPDWRATGND